MGKLCPTMLEAREGLQERTRRPCVRVLFLSDFSRLGGVWPEKLS